MPWLWGFLSKCEEWQGFFPVEKAVDNVDNPCVKLCWDVDNF